MNCNRCLTDKTHLTWAEGEVGRLARQMARTTKASSLSRLKDQLASAKLQRTRARGQVEQGHECDSRLSDEHWTKATPRTSRVV